MVKQRQETSKNKSVLVGPKILQTDREEREQLLLDLQKVNKGSQEYEEWFSIANKYLDIITSVDSRRHVDMQSLATLCSVRNFINQVTDHYKKTRGEGAKDLVTPSENTVAK